MLKETYIQELVDQIIEMQDGHDRKVEALERISAEASHLENEMKTTEKELALQNAKAWVEECQDKCVFSSASKQARSAAATLRARVCSRVPHI